MSETENPSVPPIRPPERDLSQALNAAELPEAVLNPTEEEGNQHLCRANVKMLTWSGCNLGIDSLQNLHIVWLVIEIIGPGQKGLQVHHPGKEIMMGPNSNLATQHQTQLALSSCAHSS